MVPPRTRLSPRPGVVHGAALVLVFLEACNAIFGITPGEGAGPTSSAASTAGSGGTTSASSANSASSAGTGGATTASTGPGGATAASSSGSGGSDAGSTCQGPGGPDGTKLGWVRHAGDEGDAVGNGIALTADGSVIVGGTFSDEQTNIQGQPLPYPSIDGGSEGADLFVARYASDGTPTWAYAFNGSDDQAMSSLVLDPQGNIVIAGSLRGSVTFGSKGTLTADATRSVDAEDAFVAKLDKDGQPVWARRFGGPEEELGMQATVDSAGNVYFLGVTFGGYVPGGATGDFGCPTPTTIPEGDDTVFLVKLAAADGAPLWCKTYDFWVGFYNINNPPDGLGIATDHDDGVLLAGGGDVSVANFGLGNPNGYGDKDVFVVKLDAGGTPKWQATFGDPSAQYATKIAVDACGDVILAGGFNTSVTFAPLPAVSIASDQDAGTVSYDHMFLARLTRTGDANAPLAPTWLHAYADIGEQDLTGLAVNAAGDIVVTGNLTDAAGSTGLQLGNDLLPPTGMSSGGFYYPDILLAKFKPDGTPRWARRYGGVSIDLGGAVTLDETGHTLATGTFSQPVDFGSGPITPNGQNAFVLRLGP